MSRGVKVGQACQNLCTSRITSVRWLPRVLLFIGLLTGILLVPPASDARAQVSFQAEINKNFAPISIAAGQVSRLSVTIYNGNSFQLDDAAWTDNLVGVQPGITIANPVNLTNTCGGAVVAVSGGTSLSLSGGTVPAQVGPITGECTVAVDVTPTTLGNLINTLPAGALTATGGGGEVTNATSASATLRVRVVHPPSLSKSFAPNTIWLGDISRLTITIRNYDLNSALTETTLTDNLPANVVLANPVSPSLSGCGAGTLDAVSGAGSLTLSNATIAPSGSCVARVNVTSDTAGMYYNTIPAGEIQTTQGVTNADLATAPLHVQAQTLWITKAFYPAAFEAGGTSTLTITLHNPRDFAYTGVNLMDTLPGSVLLVVNGSAATTCGGTVSTTLPRTLTLTGGSVPAGTTLGPGTCTITVEVTAPLDASAATYTNTIPAGSLITDQGDSNILPASANVSIYGMGTGVTGWKSFSPSTINPGGNSRLRISIAAPLDTSLTGFSLVDNLPPGITISNSSPAAHTHCGAADLTAIAGDSSITLANATITRPNSCVIDVWVTGATPGTYQNVIHPGDISNLEGRSLVGNLTATLTVAPSIPPSALSVSKSFYPNTVNPSGLSALTITLHNTNASRLVNVSFTDTLPGSLASGVVVAPVPNAATTCEGATITADPGTQTISMTGGVIPPQVIGVPGACTVIVDVQGSGAAATYTNRLLTTDASGTIEATGVVIRPVADASANLRIGDLSVGIVKGFNPMTVIGGSASTLSVQLSNPNNAILTGIAFTDTMPPGMILALPAGLSVGTCGGTLTGAPGEASFSFSDGTLAASATCTLRPNVTMTANGNLTNTLPASVVTTTNGATNPQPTWATLTNLPGASVTKYFTPGSVSNAAGDSSSLTITIRNTSSFLLTGLGLVDTLPGTLPAGLVLASFPAAVNNCGGTLTAVAGSQLIQLANGTLGGDSSCTLVISVRGSTLGDYENCIPIGALDNNEGAHNHEAACDTLTVTAPAVTDPAVAKSVDPPVALVGDTVTFRIVVTNNGPETAQGVVLTDVLPAFLDISNVLVSPAGPAVTITGNTIRIAFGAVAPTDVYTVTVRTVVNDLGEPPGGINTVNVTTTSTDTDPANNTASASLSIVGLDAPATGFAPDRLTRLPIQAQDAAYREYHDLWLEIPVLGVESPIVGVPLDADGWDVTWLGDQAGYLDGTAFPTWRGNSVITGHAALSSGLPGPFARLEDLGYGARVIVHGWGARSIYEVREVDLVRPDDPSIFRHEERSWITLMTCQGYDERTDSYRWRQVVRAVLTRIEADADLTGQVSRGTGYNE